MNKKDTNFLPLYFPDCLCYMDNHKNTSAGVAILVKRTYAKNYHITAKSSDALSGRLLLLSFAGKECFRSFCIVNVYLPTGTNMQEKNFALKELRNLLCPALTFIGGDFNFVEHNKDGPTVISGEAERTWMDVCAEFGNI